MTGIELDDEFAVFVAGLTAEAREGMAERLEELRAVPGTTGLDDSCVTSSRK